MVPSHSSSAQSGDALELEQTLVNNLVEAFADQAVPLGTTPRRIVTCRGAEAPSQGTGKQLAVAKRLLKQRRGKARRYRFTRNEHEYVVVFIDGKPASSTGGLEGAVRRAVKGATANVGAKLALVDPAVLRIAEVVSRSLPTAREQASEARIEKLVDALVETQDPLASVSAEIDASNAEARVRFMRNVSTMSAEEVTTASGSVARNRSQTASRWKAEKKIFSVPWQGSERYPAFQFKDGRPLPVIGEVLRNLPRTMSPWEIAFWFVSTNGWLDGAAPRERLADAPDVIQAAKRESEAIIG